MNSDYLPHFICLGAQKAGTTSLYQWLSYHPNIYLSSTKEIHFFSLFYHRGLEWYSTYFIGHESEIRGDITPYYLFHPLVPERIHRWLPDIRLIVLLRDPVERALSGLYHSIRLGYESLDPLQALLAEDLRMQKAEDRVRSGESRDVVHQEQSYLSRSRYEIQLQRYRALFPPEQILVVRSEDLFQDNNRQTLMDILEFLSLDTNYTLPPWPCSNNGHGERRSTSQEILDYLRLRLKPTYIHMEKHYNIVWPS